MCALEWTQLCEDRLSETVLARCVQVGSPPTRGENATGFSTDITCARDTSSAAAQTGEAVVYKQEISAPEFQSLSSTPESMYEVSDSGAVKLVLI